MPRLNMVLLSDAFLVVCKFVLVSAFSNQFVAEGEGLFQQTSNKRQNTTISHVPEPNNWMSKLHLNISVNRDEPFTQNPKSEFRLSDHTEHLSFPASTYILDNITTLSSLKSDVNQFDNSSNQHSKLPSDSWKNSELSRILQRSERQSNIRPTASVNGNTTNIEDGNEGYRKDDEGYDDDDDGEDEDDTYPGEETNDSNEETNEYEIPDYADSLYDEADAYNEYEEKAPSWSKAFNYTDSGIDEIRRLPIDGKTSEPAINISLVVIYSWLALVIIMIAITILMFKYKHKLSATACWRSTSRCRKVRQQQETTVEEGNNLLTHPLM